MIEIGINAEVLKDILAGRKTVEGRLAKEKFLTITPGDRIAIREDIYKDGIIIESHHNAALIQVTDVQRFESFRAMLEHVGFTNAIPGATSLEEACSEYAFYYGRADEIAHGVLALSFRLLPS